MVKIKVKVVSPNGLHMRLCGIIVNIAFEFKSNIKIIKQHETADATSIMELIMIAAVLDDELTIITNGKDEQEAAKAIEKLITSNFDGYLDPIAEEEISP